MYIYSGKSEAGAFGRRLRNLNMKLAKTSEIGERGQGSSTRLRCGGEASPGPGAKVLPFQLLVAVKRSGSAGNTAADLR